MLNMSIGSAHNISINTSQRVVDVHVRLLHVMRDNNDNFGVSSIVYGIDVVDGNFHVPTTNKQAVPANGPIRWALVMGLTRSHGPCINNNRDIREYNKIISSNANGPARQTANTKANSSQLLQMARSK